MKNVYLNLPIRDVATTDAFMTSLGFEKNSQYSSPDTTNALINDHLILMLLEDARFATFVGGQPNLVNNNLTIALECSAQVDVDTLHDKAMAAGATDATTSDPELAAVMYGKAFRDINGHIWELFAFTGENAT